MTTEAQKLALEFDADRLRKCMFYSRRSFHNGCLAWIPFLGIWFGLFAIVNGARAAWYKHRQWNPVQWQANTGTVLGFLGVLLSAIVFIREETRSLWDLHSAYRIVGAVFLMSLFAGGLALIAQITRIQSIEYNWQRIVFVGMPMLGWALIFLCWIRGSEASSVIYWFFVVIPIGLLASAIMSKPVNKFFHDHPVVPLLCATWAFILIYVGTMPAHAHLLLTRSTMEEVFAVITAVLITVAILSPIEIFARKYLPAVRRYHAESPELYATYVFAINLHVSVTVMFITLSMI